MKIPFKPGDLLVYLFIVALFGGSFFGLYQLRVSASQTQMVLELDGKVIGTYTWTPEMDPEEIRIDAGQGRYNVIRSTSQGVDIQEANCPDQICVRWGRINSPGHTIVCLPHRVVVRMIGQPVLPPEIDDIAS